MVNWAHVLRVASLGSAGIALCGFVDTAAHAAYTSYSMNSHRQKYYTDRFHLTPESLRMPYKNITFTTEDGVHLNGWLLEPSTHGNSSQKLVILMHPYNNHKSNLLAIAQGLWDSNYNVFLFDFRSFAQGRTRQSVGYYEQRDALAAVNWCVRNVNCEEGMALMGASMGGAVATCVAPKVEKVANLQAIVLDCPFSSLEAVTRNALHEHGHLPHALVEPAVHICNRINKLIYGYDFDDVRPIDAIATIDPNIPLLMIHSENDVVCPISQGQRMYENSKSNKKIFFPVDQCEHCGGFFKNQKAYIKRLTRFLDDSFESNEDEITAREIIKQESTPNEGETKPKAKEITPPSLQPTKVARKIVDEMVSGSDESILPKVQASVGLDFPSWYNPTSWFSN